MRRTTSLLITLLCCVFTNHCEAQTLDRLYATLDSVIANFSSYKEVAEKRMSRLKQQLEGSRGAVRRYDLSMELYKEYKSFDNDSAIAYISRCIDIATKLDDKQRLNAARIKLAFQCSSTGMYNEALDMLALTDTTGMPRETLGEYYVAYAHVYGELGYYSKVPQLRKQYYARQGGYLNKLFATLDEDDDEYLQRKEVAYYAKHDLENALKVNDLRLAKCDEYSRQFAIVAFYRYLDYKSLGNIEDGKTWLVKSAIADIQNAVMDQGSMWELANILLSEGDLSRSYRYINFAWECANNFGTRVRSWQVSPVLSSVDKLHQEEITKSNRLLRVLVVIISFMIVVLVLLLRYANRQRKRIEVSRIQLTDSNEKLSAANDSMSSLLQQLKDTNAQLSLLNRQLSDTNKVKDEYLGRFLQLCSQYVDKMDNMRKAVGKMVKNHDHEGLSELLRDSGFREKELAELYQNFDKAFLNLFPNFIEEFNALLKPEERVPAIQKGEGLPTMVRIFALIRLGIDDSSKIAYFLHYSVNTIYNYRARIKNSAINGRGNFEARVKKIGIPE